MAAAPPPALPGGVRGEQGDLHFAAGACAEGASGRDLVGQVAGPEAGQRVVFLVGQLERELLFAQGGDAAAEQRPVAGHHQVHSGAGALAQYPGDDVGQAAVVEFSQRGREAFPAVEQDDDVRQPVAARAAAARCS